MNDPTRFHLPAIESTADAALEARLRHKVDHKTKPLSALGQLETLAERASFESAGVSEK